MSPSPTDLTHVLSGVLPDDLHQHIPSLVPYLTGVVAEGERSMQGSGLPADIPMALLQALAGHQIDWGAYRLTFGDHAQLGVLHIQDQAQSTVRQCDLLSATSEHVGTTVSQGQVVLHDSEVTGIVAGQISESIVTTTINTFPQREPPPPDELEPLPRIDHLVERPVEYTRYAQQLTTDHLAIITGMPGVGKTALAAQLAQHHAPLEHIFWYTCLPTDGVFIVCKKLAAFLAQRHQDKAWCFINHQSTTPTTTEVLDYLPPLLRDQGYLLCLDNLHWLDDDPALPMLLTRLQHLCMEQRIRLLLISRHMPSGWDALIPPLRGLSRADTVALLQARQLTLAPALLDTLQTVTMGNAKLLELAIMVMAHRKQPQQVIEQLAAQNHIGRYLQREIYGQLDREAQQVMQALAVLGDAGGTCAAIEAVLDGQRAQHILWALTDRSLVEEHLLTETTYHQHTLVQLFCYNTIHAADQQIMHDRAGQYYVTHLATTVLGADHLLRAGAYDTAVEVLTTQLTALINHGEVHGVQRLLEKLERQQVSGPHWAAVHTALGEVHRMGGQLDRARECLQLALQHPSTSEHDINGTDQVRRYRLLAQVETHAGHYAGAQAACRAGLRIAAKAGDQSVEHAHLYAQLAEVLLRQGDYDAAEQACQEGLQLLPSESVATDVRATLWQRWGTIKGHRGDYDQAINLLTQSVHSAYQAGHITLTAVILHNLGVYLQLIGKIDQAVECYTGSLNLKRRTGDVIGEVPTLLNQGTLLIFQGNYIQALHSLQPACQQARTYQLAEYEANALVNIGVAYTQQGDTSMAKTHLHQAHTLFRELEDAYSCADCLYRLGEIALLEGDDKLARSYGEQALTVAQRIDSISHIVCALRVIGEACVYQGSLDAATTYVTKAQRMHHDLDEPYDYALLLATQARLAMAHGKWDEAHQLVGQGLELARTGHFAYTVTIMKQLLIAVDQRQLPWDTSSSAT